MNVKEFNVKINTGNEEEGFLNVPARIAGIKVGDRIRIEHFPDNREYTKEQLYLRGVTLKISNMGRVSMNIDGSMVVTIKKGPFKANEIMKENGFKGYDEIPDEGIHIRVFSDQFEFADKKVEQKTEEKKVLHSIVNKDVDPETISEMISLVDRERIIKMMSISLDRGRKPSANAVDEFLNDWAVAKYDFYLAFGRKLSVSSPIEYNMDENEISGLVYELYKKFPAYAASINTIVSDCGLSAFTDNKLGKSKFFKTYCAGVYKEGQKLSGFFSNLFKNEEFDLEFSKVMQDRKIRGDVVVSIDPYDFITSATNMHGWNSCHKIFGNMAGGSYTWCSDPNALIAYRTNGRDYTYDKGVARGVGGGAESFDFGKNTFVGNSKSWRQIINCDKKTCTFLFGREYPQNKDIDVVSQKAREIVESTIGEYIGVSEWDNYGDLRNICRTNYFGKHPVYADVSSHHYSDIENWENLTREYKFLRKSLISPHNTDMSKAKIEAGGTMKCFLCGRKISSDSHSVICGNH